MAWNPQEHGAAQAMPIYRAVDMPITYDVNKNGPAIIELPKKRKLLAERASQKYDSESGLYVVSSWNEAKRVALGPNEFQKRNRAEPLASVHGPFNTFWKGQGPISSGAFARSTGVGSVALKIPPAVEKVVLDAARVGDLKTFRRSLMQYVRGLVPLPPIHKVLPPMLPNGLKECVWCDNDNVLKVPFDDALKVPVLARAIAKRRILVEGGFALVAESGPWELQEYQLRELVAEAYCAKFEPAFFQLQAMEPEELLAQGLDPQEVVRIAEAREATRLKIIEETQAILNKLPKCYRVVMKDFVRKDFGKSLVVAGIKLDMDTALVLAAEGAESKAHASQRAKNIMGTYKYWLKRRLRANSGLVDRPCMDRRAEFYSGARCPVDDMTECMADMRLEKVPTEDPHKCCPADVMRASSALL